MDPYSILGVSKTASQEEIKKAYRRLAMEYHPDRNDSADAESKFKDASEAYSKIGNKESRRNYDASTTQGDAFGDFFSGFSDRSTQVPGWEDLFGSMRHRHHSRPFVIRAQMDITLEDLTHSTQKTFELDGQSVSFSVPPTARPGQVIAVELQAGQELHVTINLLNHPRFKLQGDDLHTHVAVPAHIAIKGGEVLVPTLDGSISLRIPAGTCSHSRLRAKTAGLKLPNGGRSSIIYEVKIDTRNLCSSLQEWKLRSDAIE